MPAWKRSVIYCGSFIIAFFLSIAIDMACGPEPDPYDYYVSFFHNSVQRNDAYRSFYFNGYLFLNDDTEQVSEEDINIKEWANYMGNNIKPADIGYVLYGMNRKADSLYFSNYNNLLSKLPDSLKSNTFLKALASKKHSMSALPYCAVVKRTQPMITRDYDDRWNPQPFNQNELHTFGVRYLERGKNQDDRFLKLRYFYQAQRLLHYGGFYQEASDIYDKYIKDYPSASHVKGWALSLKAGEEWRLGREAHAAYLFTKVFAYYPERRVQAYHEFKDMKVPLAQIVNQTTSKKEKAFIYAINSFHNPHIGLTDLNKLYTVDPKSELLSILLVREINKIEEGYLTPRLQGSKYYNSIGFYPGEKYDSAKYSYVRYMPRLKAFCNKLASERKYPEPALGKLASAYISWIQGNTADGLANINSLNHEKVSKRHDDQKHLINLLLISQGIKKLDDTTEARLLPSLQWLDKKVKQETKIKQPSGYWGDYALKYYSASSRDFYAEVLAPAYLKQKDTVMAALCVLRSTKTIIPKNAGYIEPMLGYAMPDFWQTALHSYHLKQIIKWRNTRGRQLFAASCLLLQPCIIPMINTQIAFIAR
jgi:hypothetical protein